mmetsp:Transcript_14333/g.24273  ORF Transcript_14333/g.24273 Transcript_14333/m.24273 type:complete len:336 (+) Transcript_14333:241-1248(+)|eukprot:CAMPEP_0198206974 /NCGR_PEP_ID=MMETSP1445-20131203/10477_1 /TAXON_ID=36898 /ORGANISM="Pyramimonas sp., Strain CCMP2087" /LENGTH=335 /DNA_ID=CAMNT_0043879851 /DNA_START=212 /DNA_END=1219 /DNA_ORIENTATION=-
MENIELVVSDLPPAVSPSDGREVAVAIVAEVEAASKQPGMKYGVAGEKRSNSAKHIVKACRVPGCCNKDLSSASRYCLRHRICDEHFKSLSVVFDGKAHRFCQKCTRFHEIHEFDNLKHSCRAALLLRKLRLQSKKNQTNEQKQVVKQVARSHPMSALYTGALTHPTPSAAQGQVTDLVANITAGETPPNLALLLLLSQLNQQFSAVPQAAASEPPVASGAGVAAGEPTHPALSPAANSALHSLQVLQGAAAMSASASASASATNQLVPQGAAFPQAYPACALTAALQQAALLQQQPTEDVVQQVLRNALLQYMSRPDPSLQASQSSGTGGITIR